MNTALNEARDIKRMKDAAAQTKSRHLRTDYGKAVARKTKELREYCEIMGISFKQIAEEAGL